MVRLMLVLEAAAAANPDGAVAKLTKMPCPDLYLVNRGEQAETLALVLARQLRAAGVSVELDGSGAAFGKQFKRADRSGGYPADQHLDADHSLQPAITFFPLER